MAATDILLRRVAVLDSDKERAENLRLCLRFLNYEPLLGRASERKRLPEDPGIAILLGNIPAGSELHAFMVRLASKSPYLPLLLLPNVDVGGASTEFEDRPVWRLDSPVRRTQLSHLLSRAERFDAQERRHRITGTSRCIRKVRQQIEQVSDFDTNVLITGDSGTGKELVARTIHDLSDRADNAFVPINCGAIPGELLESELFGHEKGAFTGAISARTGRFGLAEGGTLFLDEIGDMSLPMQVKLLRVLQERCFERVGSNRTRQCDVRIIAATHRDLPSAVSQGVFREDLYYRLNVYPIEMPPLRKRCSDLPALIHDLLIEHQGQNAGQLRVGESALEILANYSWPGNVRELSNLVERLAILKPEGVVESDDLPDKYRLGSHPTPVSRSAVSSALGLINANLKNHLQNVERELIEQALDATDGVVAQAARLLRMRRTTLVEKLGKHELH